MVSTLRRAIDAVELERRAAAASLQVKREAMAEHDLLITACGRILSGFYLLARRPDLAERIRLSLPRKGSSGEEPESSGEEPKDEEPSSTTGNQPAAGGGEPAAAQ